jgi:hypothetical protein
MRGNYGVSAALVLASFAMLHCGAEQDEASRGPLVSVQTDQQLTGSFESDEHVIQFSAVSTAPLIGDVRVDIGALRYELHYDFAQRGDVAQREVVADGYGGALAYEAQRPLLEAIAGITAQLEAGEREPLMHERMLHASLGMLRDSGGMPLERKVLDLGPPETESSTVDKALGDDGISCIKSGSTYFVSFDFGDTTVIDGELQAGVFECNGQCGPYCTQLQPWRMWTLDCLEHDACCNVTSDDACWTPLGECGDEYDDAMGDFLRGYAPFSRHCGG